METLIAARPSLGRRLRPVPRNSGKILSFFGAKGGVGTTTLAVHLAMFLVRGFGKKVLLIDNHAQLGHVALYLGMDGSHHHFNDLVQNVSRLDQDLLRGFIATHPSGLEVLSSPDVYGGVWKADTDSVERTLEFLSTLYDFVLLDCEASFEDINLAIIASLRLDLPDCQPGDRSHPRSVALRGWAYSK